MDARNKGAGQKKLPLKLTNSLPPLIFAPSLGKDVIDWMRLSEKYFKSFDIPTWEFSRFRR